LLPGGNRRRPTDSRFARKAKANTFCTCFGWQIPTVHCRILHIHRSVSASIGKRGQCFHWKTPGAGGGIANSVTVEGNSRVPATRQATGKMADAMSSGRNSTISQPTIAIAILLLNVDYRHFAIENRPPAIPMTR